MEAKMGAKRESSFVQELEDRLDMIFADDLKPRGTPAAGAEVLESVSLSGARESDESLFGGLTQSGSILFSPVRELKSIVLSLEWEINSQNLLRFDEEVSRLEGVFAEDMCSLAFVRVLRFLGRYVTVKGNSTDPGSINLLLATYDNLETVQLTKGMSETQRCSLMLETINNYKKWAETAELSARPDDAEECPDELPQQLSFASAAEEFPSRDTGGSGEGFTAKVIPLPTPPALSLSPVCMQPDAREEHADGAVFASCPPLEDTGGEEPERGGQEELFEFEREEPAAAAPAAPASPERDDAIAFVIEELKRMRAEFDALKEEIRSAKPVKT